MNQGRNSPVEGANIGITAPRNTLSEAVAREKSAIESELINQELLLGSLQDSISTLTQRLIPVRTNRDENDSDGPPIDSGPERMGNSHFYSSLYLNTRAIQQAVIRVNSITRDLEV